MIQIISQRKTVHCHSKREQLETERILRLNGLSYFIHNTNDSVDRIHIVSPIEKKQNNNFSKQKLVQI